MPTLKKTPHAVRHRTTFEIKRSLAAFATLVCFLSSSAVCAQSVYRCEDSRGRPVYAQKPCEAGQEKASLTGNVSTLSTAEARAQSRASGFRQAQPLLPPAAISLGGEGRKDGQQSAGTSNPRSSADGSSQVVRGGRGTGKPLSSPSGVGVSNTGGVDAPLLPHRHTPVPS